MPKLLWKYALVATFKSLWNKSGLRFALRPLEFRFGIFASYRTRPNRTESTETPIFGSVRSSTDKIDNLIL